jgi:hypothetical protein
MTRSASFRTGCLFLLSMCATSSSLPRERPLRVLLGDPPIEWESVRTFEDVLKWGDARDLYAADLIRREVLAKHRRALVIYGRAHFQRKNERTNFETADFLAGLLERDGAEKLFTIWTTVGSDELMALPRDVSLWRVPSLASLRGTVLGALDFSTYSGSRDPRLQKRDGRFVPLSPDQWRPMRMEDQFDALLSLGPVLTYVGLSAFRCADTAYMEMRTGRMALAPGGQANVDRLKRYCATRVRQ